jgi:hypothetical protein
MLAFFPWFTVDEPISFGKYTLLPHRAGQPSKFGVPKDIESILSHYRLNVKLSVRDYCVLQIQGKTFGDDFTDAERAETFEFAEILAIGALSRRRFFDQTEIDYTNRATVTGIIQGYKENQGGVSVRSRLRYGSTLGYFTDDAYLVLCPPHIHPNKKVKFDGPLITALLGAYTQPDADQFESSIAAYNQANTDSDQTPEHIELVQTSGAFEALFDLGKGKENELAKSFLDCLSKLPEEKTLPVSKRQQAKFPQSTSPRDSWIKDLFRLRGALAHGRSTTGYRPLWSVFEHLLLGSFIFPICLKIELEKKGHYTLTEDDLKCIFAFDRLLRSENLNSQVPDKQIDEMAGVDEQTKAMMKTWVWSQIISDASWEWSRNKAVAKLEAQSKKTD